MKLQPKYQKIWDELEEKYDPNELSKADPHWEYSDLVDAVWLEFLQRIIPVAIQAGHLKKVTSEFLKTVIQTEKE